MADQYNKTQYPGCIGHHLFVMTCFLEPLLYRPLTVIWRIEAFFKRRQWGHIERQEF